MGSGQCGNQRLQRRHYPKLELFKARTDPPFPFPFPFPLTPHTRPPFPPFKHAPSTPHIQGHRTHSTRARTLHARGVRSAARSAKRRRFRPPGQKLPCLPAGWRGGRRRRPGAGGGENLPPVYVLRATSRPARECAPQSPPPPPPHTHTARRCACACVCVRACACVRVRACDARAGGPLGCEESRRDPGRRPGQTTRTAARAGAAVPLGGEKGGARAGWAGWEDWILRGLRGWGG